MTARIIMKLIVTNIVQDTPTVKIYTLRHPIHPALPKQSAGAHVDVRLPDGKIRQYSLCGSPDDESEYRIAVRRESTGRGGSCWLHDNVEIGSVLHVTAPRNNFPLVTEAKRNVFIAGGIGITPFSSIANIVTSLEGVSISLFPTDPITSPFSLAMFPKSPT